MAFRFASIHLKHRTHVLKCSPHTNLSQLVQMTLVFRSLDLGHSSHRLFLGLGSSVVELDSSFFSILTPIRSKLSWTSLLTPLNFFSANFWTRELMNVIRRSIASFSSESRRLISPYRCLYKAKELYAATSRINIKRAIVQSKCGLLHEYSAIIWSRQSTPPFVLL